jgi:hypothetical protein
MGSAHGALGDDMAPGQRHASVVHVVGLGDVLRVVLVWAVVVLKCMSEGGSGVRMASTTGVTRRVAMAEAGPT